jgi:hypothetical protein
VPPPRECFMAVNNNLVTVACKVPNGLLLRIFKMAPAREQTPTGYRDIERAELVGEPVRINGPSAPKDENREIRIVGRYALTPNVNKDFFDEWLRQNADHEAVKAGLIFAHSSQSRVSDQAKERKDVMSGLEPLNVDRIKRGDKTEAVDGRIRQISTTIGIEKADVR